MNINIVRDLMRDGAISSEKRMRNPTTNGRQPTTCLRARLAETAVAAVDYCQCGHMHLHLGPFSMRLTPEALSGLVETLTQAIAVHGSTTQSVTTLALRSPSYRRGGDA
jgi:hypothetical protein